MTASSTFRFCSVATVGLVSTWRSSLLSRQTEAKSSSSFDTAPKSPCGPRTSASARAYRLAAAIDIIVRPSARLVDLCPGPQVGKKKSHKLPAILPVQPLLDFAASLLDRLLNDKLFEFELCRVRCSRNPRLGELLDAPGLIFRGLADSLHLEGNLRLRLILEGPHLTLSPRQLRFRVREFGLRTFERLAT